MQEEILKVENLSKRFDDTEAIAGITFSIKKGAITSLIGHNGSGKSTLFSIINGLIKPDQGSVFLRGENITKYSPAKIAKLGVGYLMQEHLVLPNLTVLENIMIGVKGQKGESIFNLFFSWQEANDFENAKRITALDLLEKYHLHGRENQSAGELSIGEQKRVALARINATEADLLILDEPMSGLDPVFIRDMISSIIDLKNQGKTIFLIEHDMKFVMDVSDYIFVLNNGKLIANGKAEEIMTDNVVMEAYIGY